MGGVCGGACFCHLSPTGTGGTVRAAYPATQPFANGQENQVPDSLGTCLWSGEASVGLEGQKSPTSGSGTTIDYRSYVTSLGFFPLSVQLGGVPGGVNEVRRHASLEERAWSVLLSP